MSDGRIITQDLNRNFQAAVNGLPVNPKDFAPDIAGIQAKAFAAGQQQAAMVSRGKANAYASSGVSNTGIGMTKMASGGIVYTQPQFFSPIHTPINWQIPTKRKEQYQWSRYFYENEPKVATALEFYSKFPCNGFTNECPNRYVKRYFDKLSEKLRMLKWLRVMSHEVHLLGDCFPFLEVECEKCGGRGTDSSGRLCEHHGGSFKRLVILNPECVEVYSDPISPDSMIAFMPNDELRTLIMKRGPGHEKFSQDIVKMIMAGMPIPLDNRNVSHIKYCDNGYNKYGIGMLRRLFPILAYKTKLMTAQWIIAERLILPIKVAKVGSDERPASAGDLADINSKLAQVANDPNLTLVTHHAFELDWFGACNSLDTNILTKDGWKNYCDVGDDEEIGTFNPVNGLLEYQVPLARHEHYHKGEMCLFQSRQMDACVTPNHKMMVVKKNYKNGNDQYVKVNASAVKDGNRFLFTIKWQGEIPEKLPYSSSLLGHLKLDDFLKFAGYYLSEGGLKIEKGTIWALHVSQSTNSPHFSDMRETMMKLNGKIQEGVDDRRTVTNIQFLVNNCAIAREVKEMFGANSKTKRIPRWMLNLPVEKLSILLAALMAGDGGTRFSTSGNPRFCYGTTSPGLADDVQELVFKMGNSPKAFVEKSKNPKHNDMYRIRWSNTTSNKGGTEKVLDQDISRVPYDGKVWCFTVPNGFIVTRRNGKIGIHGNSGKILQLTNEFEIISQEILDGLGVNKVLLNGEGPVYSSAAIGVEVMIDKLDSWRDELSEWVEQKVYLPIAKMMGFMEKNEWGEMEYVYPRIKWDIMHLRDMQQMRTFILQLHEKGAISTQTMLKAFDIDYDQEVELLRFERAQGAMGGGAQKGGGEMGGGFGGGAGGGGGGGLPDMGDIGGELGGIPPPEAGGGGGAPPAGGGAEASTSVANISQFGGKVLKKKSREKISKYKERLFQKQDDASGYARDGKGRVMFTGPERELLKELSASVRRGEIRHNIRAQFPVQAMGQEYSLDFAMPDLKIGIEVDGALFHSTDDQIASDKKRDSNIAQLGWTILRFTDREVENQSRQVIESILKQIIQKEVWLKENRPA